jgi:hypothetical protein
MPLPDWLERPLKQFLVCPRQVGRDRQYRHFVTLSGRETLRQ